MEKEDLMDVVQRWNGLGLLEGLHNYEKEELALLYDNSTRVMLSKASEIDEDVFEVFSDVLIPSTRRLYRRVGINYDINNFVDELLKSTIENYETLMKEPGVDEDGNLINPIVDFCVEFSDHYEDETITSKIFSKEKYDERVHKILGIVEEIMLSDRMVSFVDRSDDEWKIKWSDDTTKSPTHVRIWNQKRAVETLNGVLNETNRGI